MRRRRRVRAALLRAVPARGRPPPPAPATGCGARRCAGDLRRQLDRHGRPIAYGYLDRRYPLAAYQTVFGTRPGSAEMASAGTTVHPRARHPAGRRGVAVAPVTLHTGVSSQEAGEAPAAGVVRGDGDDRAAGQPGASHGGRVVAVGTTGDPRARVRRATGRRRRRPRGWTDRVVTPAAPARVVDGLVTGWHDPMASHLLLVEAVAGARLTQAAYDAAVAEGYLWHEFGDSALLLRR